MSIQLNRDEFVPGAYDEYDPRLLERRNFAEGNVCGCLLNDLDLFDDCSFIPDDFVTFHGRLLYSVIKQLHDKGVKKFDEVTFVTTLPEDFVKTVDETYGGYIQITNLMKGIDNKNWDTYKEALNKSNILLRLFKKGFNIFGKITLDNGKKIIPFDFFEGLTSTEILEFYEGTIASIQTHVDNLKLIEEGYIEFDDEWIEKLKKKIL